MNVSFDVTNTGAVAGDEVVQLYVRDDTSSTTTPVRSLQGVQRVPIAAGATAHLVLSIDVQVSARLRLNFGGVAKSVEALASFLN